MEYFLMQDEQRQFFPFVASSTSSYPSSPYNNLGVACPPQQMASPYAHQQMPVYPAYYVDSPSTVLDLSSMMSSEDQRGSERLSEPFSASLLSRSTSFLSNYTSEAVSLPDVSARLQSWCKSRPAASWMTTNKWATSWDEEAGFEDEPEEEDIIIPSRCLDISKSVTLCSCLTVFLTALLLALCTSVYWLVCHPLAPRTTFKGVEFRGFSVLQGYDRRGVPTDMVSVESLVRLAFNNPSKHYGTFVTGADVELSYLPRPIAHGQVLDFYQDRQSNRIVTIKAKAEYVPLYGAGPSLQQALLENRHIPLGLTIAVKSHVNLFGSLVKKHFTEIIACNVVMNPNTGVVAATYCEPPRRREEGETPIWKTT